MNSLASLLAAQRTYVLAKLCRQHNGFHGATQGTRGGARPSVDKLKDGGRTMLPLRTNHQHLGCAIAPVAL